MCNIVCASALHLCETCTGFVIVDVGDDGRINVNCHQLDRSYGLVLDQQKTLCTVAAEA